MKIIERIKSRLIYPAAYSYVSFQSMRNEIRSLGKKDKVHFATPYAGQKIMLMALYQKGELRADVIAALAAAKAQGIYVIGVNTLKLSRPENCREFMDCYIERFNFGRDFGSYKSGFKYIYANGLAEQCPRLLMINDSVFFSKKHIEKFIEDMFGSDIEVLGATENHEIEHHLGSFCIAMDHVVLNSKKIKNYWRKYKCSDVRPIVIKRGEMALSKALRSAVTRLDSFGALYDVTHAINRLRSDSVLFDNVAVLSRSSESHWETFSFASVSQSLYEKYLHSKLSVTGTEASVEIHNMDDMVMSFGSSTAEFKKVFLSLVANGDSVGDRLDKIIDREIVSNFADSFSRGSQVHQNGPFLHRIGLAFVKLDGLYRGTFSSEDVENIADDLLPEQRDAFRRIMYSRPNGETVYYGWKRAAFDRGLI